MKMSEVVVYSNVRLATASFSLCVDKETSQMFVRMQVVNSNIGVDLNIREATWLRDYLTETIEQYVA